MNQDLRNKIEDFLNECSGEDLLEIISDINSYNGTLEHLGWEYFDDDFFNVFFHNNPMEAARATFFGDIENWNDKYIRFDSYGNLESMSYLDYDSDDIDEILEVLDDMSTEDFPYKLQSIIEEYENEE